MALIYRTLDRMPNDRVAAIRDQAAALLESI